MYAQALPSVSFTNVALPERWFQEISPVTTRPSPSTIGFTAQTST